MIYEYRQYHMAPGKARALHQRFAEVTQPLFVRHGFRVVGYWTELIGDSSNLHYLLAWQDFEERERKWAAFQGDQEWQTAREASERGGPLVEKIVTSLWRPTAYSPMQ